MRKKRKAYTSIPVKKDIPAFRCVNGHFFLHAHDACLDCGGPLRATRVSAEGHLLTHTTVLVNPSGEPHMLGIAKAKCGAKTLCIIRGSIRGTGRDRVRLEKIGDCFYANGKCVR
jgi:uncharacterized OB-fold protein